MSRTVTSVPSADAIGPDPRTDVAAALVTPGAPTPQMADFSEGMAYLDTLPRRIVTVYIPLLLIMIVLLFPFYWMVLTAIKPDEQLLDLDTYNPFFVTAPTFKHIYRLLFETAYPRWLWNTMFISVAATVLSLFASVLAAYAITRIRYRGANYVGAAIFLAYLVPPSILFIPLSTVIH
jgi:multiple sugar transport system permease protein